MNTNLLEFDLHATPVISRYTGIRSSLQVPCLRLLSVGRFLSHICFPVLQLYIDCIYKCAVLVTIYMYALHLI